MPIKSVNEIEAKRDAALELSGKAFLEAAVALFREVEDLRAQARREVNNQVPQWVRDSGIPIVYSGHYRTPHIYMTCAVKFHTIVWDPDYVKGVPLLGWKPVDRPPLMVDVRIPVSFADSQKCFFFNGSGVMASQTMPHSHKGGEECFIGLAGDTQIKTFRDYEIVRGRVATFLGGANLASLASHWDDWSPELQACFPHKLAKVIARESRPNEDPNKIWGAKDVPADYSQADLADLTWGVEERR